MNKSGLIELLKTFTSQEMREFGEFVESPFFNKNKNVIKLYEIVKKAYPNLDSDKLDKEKVFTKIFPGEKFKDNTMRLLMFYLYEIAKKYIAVSRVLSDSFGQKEKLLDFYMQRNLLKEGERTAREIEAELLDTKLIDENYYMNKFLFDFGYLNLLDRIHMSKYEKYFTKNHIESALRSLTYYYLARSLKFYTIIRNILKILKVNFDFKFFENILDGINIEDYKDSPVIITYYNAAMALRCPDEEIYFYRMKECAEKYENELEKNNLLDIYVNMENYCIWQSRLGKVKFDRELFDIYKRELERKLYEHHGYMTHHFYKGVVVTALDLKEFEWTEEFIEKYKNEIIKEFRDDVYYFCLSRVEMKKGNFEKALEYLSKVHTDEIYLKVETRLMQGILFYELNHSDSLSSLLDTLRHFFKNQKFIPEDRLNFYQDFTKFLSKLNSLKYRPDPLEGEKLKDQILAKEKVFVKKWLIEKADELIK